MILSEPLDSVILILYFYTNLANNHHYYYQNPEYTKIKHVLQSRSAIYFHKANTVGMDCQHKS